MAGRRRGAADRAGQTSRRAGGGRRRHLPAVRGAGPGDPRPAPASPDRARARQDRRRAARGYRRPIQELLAILRSRERLLRDPAQRAGQRARALRRPAPHDTRGRRVRSGHRGPDPARGHGRHGQQHRLHQAGAAVRPIARSGAAARAAPAWRRATTISSATCSSPTRTRRCCSSRRCGHGLQAEGLPAADRHAAGARQGDGQPAAPVARRDDHDRDAAARGRGGLGRSRRHVRDVKRQRAAQQAVRLHQCHDQRQDRDEAGRGRSPHRRRDLQRARPTSCSRPSAASASASRSTTSASSSGAPRPASAASTWNRATR